MSSGLNRKRVLEFRNSGTEAELKARIQALFDKAKGKWEGVFPDDDKIKLSPSHLAVCVSSLENVKLFNFKIEENESARMAVLGG